MSGLKLIIPPDANPVSLVEAKGHMRVEVDDDDLLIATYIDAATNHCEKFLGRALMPQTWDYYIDAFPVLGGVIKLPKPPLIDVIGVFYQGTVGSETEYDVSSYVVNTVGDPGSIVLPSSGSWPTSATVVNAIRVRFECGYIDDTVSPAEANVPPAFRQAILMMVASFYEHREEVVIGQTATKIPLGAENLLRQQRFDLSMA